MKIQFTSKSKKIVLIDKTFQSQYYRYTILNFKKNVEIRVIPKYDLSDIGSLLWENKITLTKFLKLKNKMKKNCVIKIQKDKNTKVLIEKKLF